MELSIDENILKAYGYNFETVALHQIGSGHINRTYLLSTHSDEKYILQNINTQVFKDPFAIANNIKLVADYLKLNFPDYLFPAPIAALNGELMFQYQNEYWRLLPFVQDTIAFDTLSDSKQAYEAAKQFGKLSRLLNNYDASTLKPTIPGFHDLAWRYEQFTFALSKSTTVFKEKAKQEIETALHHHFIIAYYRSYEHRQDFPNRVMHHDTKISNVLLKENNFEGVCVIDLDTLMPGKFISDLGDMMRTYLCAFSENEKDLSKINIRLDYFKATIKGYLFEMASTLTGTEKELVLFSGKYMIYMQALRFLTDYLNGSDYYPISYPEQNLDRAKNQFKLLSELFENEKTLQDIIEECLS
ncbi:aminoglycoside phosphotransferase family protein [Pedobacter frigiditerrae]|uniref:Aminoglycoside phosphotransferase family protein n=1 Tax=Pedobacter frigiditerrae TaxID=2530452 RepID=A0A4R0MNS1_9SPHI|nr:phosphotransferase [Pedobacter frigiditerrae]TCC88137.1 aminoglycoside phosphotransferase family protein [Pedobacter frigiditerrae]